MRNLGVALVTLGVIAGILYMVTISFDSYDPRRYWIPPRIPGYDVLAVTSELNTPCFPPGMMILVLVPSRSENSLDGLYAFVWSIRRYISFYDIGYEITGTYFTKDQILANMRKSNEQMKEAVKSNHGQCIKLGPM